MSFKDKQFHERFKDNMWNHSERAFEAQNWPPKRYRFGLDQMTDDSPIDSWALTAFVRHMPDYICQLKDRGEPFLIEVQGTGKDRLHKFKEAKLEQLVAWNKHHDVWFWLWDNNQQQGTMISLNMLKLIIAQGQASKGLFDGHRPYWAVHVDIVNQRSDWEESQGRYT